jgi:glycosyltransferase involved in cell wall biosynthesis
LKIKEKFRIALISTPLLKTPPDTYGGLEQVVADLASELAKLGHDVTVFAADGSRVQGCHIVKLGPPALETGIPVNSFEEERRTYHIYKDMLHDFDLIHGHSHFAFEYLAKINNRKLKVCHTQQGEIRFGVGFRARACVISKQFEAHSDLHALLRSGDYKPFLKDLLMTTGFSNLNLNLIAVSKWMTRVYEAQGYKSRWVHNGVNLDRYEFKERKGDRLLFVGRIDPIKQPHLSIQVAKRLNVCLDIVGATAKSITNQSYVDKIKKMCDGKQIRLYDEASQKLNPKLKTELMQNAKCLLFTSAWGEPFGLVPLEAMACGTPVVALNDGAVEEFVQEGGIVCDALKKEITSKVFRSARFKITPKCDLVDALVSAVKRVDSIHPTSCLENAKKFSKEHMAECYNELYNGIIAGEKW